LDYISGKRYQAQRNIDRRRDKTGIFISNAPTEHFTQLDNKRSDVPTANKIAAAMGMTAEVVRRNVPYAKGIDAIKEVAPDLAEKILKPKPEEPKLSKRKRTSTIRQIELVWLHKERICRPTHST
jgi:hypothetical protein